MQTRFPLFLAPLAVACSLTTPPAPYKSGDGVTVGPDGTITVAPVTLDAVFGACAEGEGPRRTSTGWSCEPLPAPIDHSARLAAIEQRLSGLEVAPDGCASTQYSAFDAVQGKFVCRNLPAPFDDTTIRSRLDTLEELATREIPACADTGSVLTYHATRGYECRALPDTALLEAEVAALPRPTAPCGANQTLTWNGMSYTCRNLPDPFDPTALNQAIAARPIPTTCADNTASRWNGTAWVCVGPYDVAGLTASINDLTTRLNTLQSSLPARGAGQNLGVTMMSTGSRANGECLTLSHGWNTNAVGCTAWVREPNGPGGQASWVPVPPTAPGANVNIAAGKETLSGSACGSCSAGAAYYHSSKAVDADVLSFWQSEIGGAGWLRVDLGRDEAIDRVKLLIHTGASNHSAVTSWTIDLSSDGTQFRSVATGSCSFPGTCPSTIDVPLPAGSAARYVRFTPVQYQANSLGQVFAMVLDFQIYAAQQVVHQPDPNTLRFCNYTGATRELALLAWK